MKFNICAVGITLLISSIYMSYMKRNNSKFSKFNNLLNKEQKEIYQTIVHERLKIYIKT